MAALEAVLQARSGGSICGSMHHRLPQSEVISACEVCTLVYTLHMGRTKVEAYVCDVCGYKWLPRASRLPIFCPAKDCRSRRWDKCSSKTDQSATGSELDAAVKTSAGRPWLGKINNGYGTVYRNGIETTAHRYGYSLAHGAVPSDCDVDHICRNTLCQNPNHLRLLDRSAHGRMHSIEYWQSKSLGAP